MDKNKLVDTMHKWVQKTNRFWNEKYAEALVDALLPLINAEIETQKHRADVVEEALILACGNLSSYYYMTGAEALAENYIHQAAERLKEKRE